VLFFFVVVIILAIVFCRAGRDDPNMRPVPVPDYRPPAFGNAPPVTPPFPGGPYNPMGNPGFGGPSMMGNMGPSMMGGAYSSPIPPSSSGSPGFWTGLATGGVIGNLMGRGHPQPSAPMMGYPQPTMVPPMNYPSYSSPIPQQQAPQASPQPTATHTAIGHAKTKKR